MGSLYAKRLVDLALGEVGYQCGDNKWNKYANTLDRVDYFTGCGKKQNLDFCAVGLCWLLYMATQYPSAEEDPESAKWSAHYFGFQSDTCDMAAVVKYLYQYFADNNATTDNPERGDFAIFQKSNGVMYHCGVVTSWDSDHIYITEFNTSGGKVLTHTYNYSDIGNKIKCFCRPRYDGWEEEGSTSDQTVPPILPSTPEVNPNYRVQTNGGILRLREEPNTSSDIIECIPNGTMIHVDEIVTGETVNYCSKWAHVCYNELEGYVSRFWIVPL